VRLSDEADIVLLPMTAGTAQDSLEIVSRLAPVAETPILLAVQQGCEEAAAEALRGGARAFVLLPYRRENLLRQLRQLAQDSASTRSPAVLSAGPIVLHLRRREVTVGGLATPMPAREFDILRMLLEREGEVVTGQEFAARLGGRGNDGSNSLAVHIRRLRERLEPDPSRPCFIRTVRGVGYKLQIGALSR